MQDRNSPDAPSASDLSSSRDWKTAKRRRRHLIGVRVDDDELERLSAAADIRNTTPASYLREQGLEAPPPRQARRLSADTVILGRVLAEMGHIGSNVNQIARVLNARGDVAMHDINEAMQEVTGLSRVIRTALGRKPRP